MPVNEAAGTYQYLNTTFQHNFDPPQQYPGDYATDLLSDKALAWIDEAAKGSAPFFLAINPVNPHSNVNYTKDGKTKSTPPIPAPRHANQFLDVKVPQTPNLNPKQVRLVHFKANSIADCSEAKRRELGQEAGPPER